MRAGRPTLKMFLLGAIVALMGTDSAFAGWMGFRNDTKDTIVVQETIIVNGRATPGRPQRLFAGESVRDVPQAAGQRRISVYDSRNLNQPIFTGGFPCPAANENVLYLIKSDGKGGIAIEAIKLPVQAQPTPKK